MPHQCVRCGILYDDGSGEIISGCKCGGKLFFFVKKEALKQVQEVTSNLTKEDKARIEKDVMDIFDRLKQKRT